MTEQPQRPEPRIVGYECTAHGFSTSGKAALQLHMSGHLNCSPGVVREAAPESKPEHQCEAWQQGLSAQHGIYCMACGKPAPLPPKPEPAEPPHMGPQWEHDCDACIYLGTRYGSARQWDLYWCPPNKFNEDGNLIARHGTLGDYVSGLGFVDREPMLAIAGVLALKQGYIGAHQLVAY